MSNDSEFGVVHIPLDTTLLGVLPEIELTLTATPMQPKEETRLDM